MRYWMHGVRKKVTLMRYKIGTRGSKLALMQANIVKERLETAFPQHQFCIEIIKTQGDKDRTTPLHQMATRGVFVRAIETKLQCKEIDLAIHSMKDMPSLLPDDLYLCKAMKGEDPRDVFIQHPNKHKQDIQCVASGSIRRKVLFQEQYPNVEVVGIRGNIDTRLQKLKEEGYDGLILAAAGLHRLNLHHEITAYLDPTIFIPACTQGILGIEVRKEDSELIRMVESFYDAETQLRVQSERAFLTAMGGGCQKPMGAYLKVEEDQICLYGMLAREDETHLIKESITGTKAQAEEIGIRLAKQLLEKVEGK